MIRKLEHVWEQHLKKHLDTKPADRSHPEESKKLKNTCISYHRCGFFSSIKGRNKPPLDPKTMKNEGFRPSIYGS